MDLCIWHSCIHSWWIYLSIVYPFHLFFVCFFGKKFVILCILVWGIWEKNSAYATNITEALAEFSWIFFNSLPNKFSTRITYKIAEEHPEIKRDKANAKMIFSNNCWMYVILWNMMRWCAFFKKNTHYIPLYFSTALYHCLF